jgi:hypothetical protein
MADHHGVAGAVAEAVREAQATLPAPAEQLDLLAASQRPGSERIHVRSPSGQRTFVSEERLASEIARTGKAGRPRGAQNLSTRELKDWIVRLLGGTPQERLARWAMLEPEELARRLGCTVTEAFDRQVKILEGLSPYLMAKMVPVDEDGNAVPFIQLVTGGQVQGADGQLPWARFLPKLKAETIDVTPEAGS